MTNRYVVIGAGPAGVTAAETLRSIDPEGWVALVGDEPEPPYSRMAIPYLLTGKIAEQGTYLRKTTGHFRSAGVEVIQSRVRAVDPAASQVTLQDGRRLGYERLLVATGSRPVIPNLPGANLPGVHPCWTLADARSIAARAAPGARVVLIGAGFIGSIVLEALVQRGCQLSVVEMGDRMVPRMMNSFAGGLIRQWCERKGVRVQVSTRVTEIEDAGPGRLRVRTDDGAAAEAELVIMAIGVRPNVELLNGSGVELGRGGGVLVDEHHRTSVPQVYSARDVAEGRDFSTGGYAVHAIQPTATEHGRIAALNMAGQEVAYRGSLNMNVLDTLGLVSSSFGSWMGVEGGDTAELKEPEAYRYLNLQFEGDVLVGATSLGHTEHIGVLRGLIQGRVPLGPWKDRLLRNPSRVMEAYLERNGLFT
jgi:NADPH-dependent 2,4-dienoyl-CoA reductase/sulfur reductase-like enzyme